MRILTGEVTVHRRIGRRVALGILAAVVTVPAGAQRLTLSQLQAEIVALQSDSAAHQQAITALQTENAAQQQAIVALQSQNATQESEIAALDTRLTALEALVAKLHPCAFAKKVFATSAVFAGDLGGLPSADQKCALAAANAGLSGTYRAWIADGTASPAARFTPASTAYCLVNDVVIAANWADLTDGTLAHAIDADELGNPAGGGTVRVWTGASAAGGTSGPNCLNWASGASGDGGRFGSMSSTDAGWSDGGSLSNQTCNSTAHLYCFEQ